MHLNVVSIFSNMFHLVDNEEMLIVLMTSGSSDSHATRSETSHITILKWTTLPICSAISWHLYFETLTSSKMRLRIKISYLRYPTIKFTQLLVERIHLSVPVPSRLTLSKQRHNSGFASPMQRQLTVRKLTLQPRSTLLINASKILNAHPLGRFDSWLCHCYYQMLRHKQERNGDLAFD